MGNVRKNGCLMNENGQMICEYCGKAKQETGITFFIGAKRDCDVGWTMVEGTGKIACDECYPKAAKIGAERIDQMIAEHNAKVEASK